MFIATYIYPDTKNEVWMGKVSLFNYLEVALTSLKGSLRRHRVIIKPIKWAEKHFHGVQCFPTKYKHYPCVSADPRHVSVRWIAPWNLRYYLETKDYITDWAIDRRF